MGLVTDSSEKASPVPRTIQVSLERLAGQYPVVTVTGPRQSGKTTLCRATFPGKPWVNLELPDERAFARSDPRGFLARFPDGGIIDEVQHAPDLLSYIQDLVDRRRRPGEWILTGSQNFALLERVTQSLAGRTAVLRLLPLALDEMRRFPNPPGDLLQVLWMGGYPPVHDHRLDPYEWLASYTATYVERDVRQVLNVVDLVAFQTFVGLCAGRAGQLLNLSSLGADCGITHATARAWISVLEASYIAFRLPPFHGNVSKRLIKSPKLFFYDSGLLCYLLGIREPEQIRLHPQRGAIFESWAVSEIVKARSHRGATANLTFYRDQRGSEVDAVVELGRSLLAVEIKSGETVADDFFRGLRDFAGVMAAAGEAPERVEGALIYGGRESYVRSGTSVIAWSDIAGFDWLRGAAGAR